MKAFKLEVQNLQARLDHILADVFVEPRDIIIQEVAVNPLPDAFKPWLGFGKVQQPRLPK